MKTHSLVFALALLLLCPMAFAQWFTQNSGTTRNLHGVSFTGAYTGAAVGDSGTIIRTTDGGGTWTVQASGTMALLHAVSFTDANTGVAVGDSGIIIQTTDGGATWNSKASGTTAELFGVSCTDANTGTAVGSNGTILRTTDAGAHWTGQSSGIITSLYAVCFTNANRGIAVGDSGAILRTTNGGSTWSAEYIGTASHLYGVSFADAATGAIVGVESSAPPVFAQTVDSGRTWAKLSLYPARGMLLRAVAFRSAQKATAVGGFFTDYWEPPVVWSFDILNGGIRSEDMPLEAHMLRAVCFMDSLTGTIVGGSGSILRTTTGGATWVDGGHAEDVPKHYTLSQNYPNPFNPSTTIKYELANSADVNLSVFDMLGRQVSVLVNERRDAGVHEVRFDASGLASGMYLYRLTAGRFVQTRKLLLLR